MLPYYGLIFCIGLIRLITININDKKKRDDIFVVAACVFTVMLQGLRKDTVGIDLQMYIPAYDYIGLLPWLSPVYNFEVGYRVFCKVLYILGVSKQLFLGIVAAICQGSVFWFIRRYSKFPAISIVIYLTFGLFTFSFSGLRQMMALSIALFSYNFVEKKEPIRFCLVVAIASLFHASVLVFLIVYPLYYWKFPPNTVLFVFPAFLMEILLGDRLVAIMVSLYQQKDYQAENTGAYEAFLMYALVWFAAEIFMLYTSRYNAFRNYLLIGAFVQGLGLYHSSVARIGYYFMFFICLVLPQTISDICKDDWKSRFCITAVLIACCFVFFNMNTGNGYLNVSPYIPFWEN